MDNAIEIGRQLKVDWNEVNVDQFRKGLKVELEHGLVDPLTNVTDNDPIRTAKIALAHLNELPDYYSRLAKMEAEGKMAKAKIPESLGKCEVIKEHDDGDLTIECGGKKMVVTPEGEIFEKINPPVISESMEESVLEKEQSLEVVED
jgi:hypothetical protein